MRSIKPEILLPFHEIQNDFFEKTYNIVDYYDRPLQPECLTNFNLSVNANIMNISFRDKEDFVLIENLYRNENIRDC